MNISEEVIEKAAEAAWREDAPGDARMWDRVSKIEKDAYRAVSRAVIESVWPDMREQS